LVKKTASEPPVLGKEPIGCIEGKTLEKGNNNSLGKKKDRGRGRRRNLTFWVLTMFKVNQKRKKRKQQNARGNQKEVGEKKQIPGTRQKKNGLTFRGAGLKGS